MANIFAVAKYVLSRTGMVTTLKLQKLLYYCQAWSLVWDEEPMFEEDFEAWANGPVNRNLYNTHRGRFTISMVDEARCEGNLTKANIETIDAVLEHYASMQSYELSSLTHQERPWKETRGDCKDGTYCDRIISKDLMFEYYASLG